MAWTHVAVRPRAMDGGGGGGGRSLLLVLLSAKSARQFKRALLLTSKSRPLPWIRHWEERCISVFLSLSVDMRMKGCDRRALKGKGVSHKIIS